jgi:hypothetical protein
MVFSFKNNGVSALAPWLNIPVYRQVLPDASRELRRARRHERPLSLVFLSPLIIPVHTNGQDEAGPLPSVPLVYPLLGSYLRNVVRETDLLAAIPENMIYALFLPETGRENAAGAIRRFDAGFHRLARSGLRGGVAEFPKNGLTLEELFLSARKDWYTGAAELNSDRQELAFG